MAREDCELSVRGNVLDLPPVPVPLLANPRWLPLLSAESALAAGRIVAVQSDHLVELRLTWFSGAGRHNVQISCARGIRCCVWAKSLTVDVRHKSGALTVKTSITVADGWERTRNHWLVDIGGGPVQTVAIPPFADRVRLLTSDPATLPAAQIDFYDMGATLFARTAGNAQPDGGLPLAGTERLDILTAFAGRVLFELTV